MAKVEEKFIVISVKRLEELNAVVVKTAMGNITHDGTHPGVRRLRTALEMLQRSYERDVGKKMYRKYYLCNQDEPYAEEVIKIILEGEDKKERAAARGGCGKPF